MEEWEARWAEERAAIVARIKENNYGKSADGKTLHMVGEINVGSAIILKNAIRKNPPN